MVFRGNSKTSATLAAQTLASHYLKRCLDNDGLRANASARDDQLAAHRVPPQLMGIIPSNTGGFGDADKAAMVFARNEVKPLQDRLMELNTWLGEEVVTFTPYELE